MNSQCCCSQLAHCSNSDTFQSSETNHSLCKAADEERGAGGGGQGDKIQDDDVYQPDDPLLPLRDLE
jgi:hypothetical protein